MVTSQEKYPAITRMEILFAALALILSVHIRTTDFTKPIGARGWQSISAKYSNLSRNYVERGYLKTRFAPTKNFDPTDQKLDFYMDHPPLYPLVVSLAFHVFGVHEWSARLVTLLASLVELLAIWLITRRLFGRRSALAALAMGAVIPATAFYGVHICEYGAQLMAFICLSFYFYLKYLEQPKPSTFVLLLTCLTLGAATDWPTFHLMGWIVLHFIYLKKWKQALSILLLIIALPALHMIHIRIVSGGFQSSDSSLIFSAFIKRTWGEMGDFETIRSAFSAIWSHILLLFIWPVIGLSILGFFKRKFTFSMVVLIMAGVADILVFLEGAARHEFWVIPLTLPLLPLAGGGVVWLSGKIKSHKIGAMVLWGLVLWVMVMGYFRSTHLFERNRDYYYHTLGKVINKQSAPGEAVATSESWHVTMAYYAQRKIIGDCVSIILKNGKLVLLPGYKGKLVIPQKKYRPHHDHDLLLKLAKERFPHKVVKTKECGDVYVFDIHVKKQL